MKKQPSPASSASFQSGHNAISAHSGRSRQQGFLLVQLAIAITMASGFLAYVGYRYWQANVRTIADDRARLVGATMASVNDATKTYMTTYFTQIQRGQAVTMGASTVPAGRVRTPTTADLRDLGMLAARSAGPIVYNGLEVRFNVAITVDTSGGCVIPTCNLRSVVSSSVPLLDVRTGLPDVRRATIAAATASPGNAGVAMPTSMGGNPALFVSQAGNQVALNAAGTAGVIGIANGYDSAGFMEFDRRDGSLPRTGSINMQDVMGTRHDINRAGAVGAQTVTAEGRIKTSEYLDLDGPVVTEGTACDKDGLVARAAGGLILSCQSGVWRAAQGSTRLIYGSNDDYIGRTTVPYSLETGQLKLCVSSNVSCGAGHTVTHTVTASRPCGWWKSGEGHYHFCTPAGLLLVKDGAWTYGVIPWIN